MILQELCVHHQQSNNELSVGPKGALIHKKAPVAIVDQSGSPGFGGPRSIEILFQEKSELIWISHGNDLNVAALVVRLHSMALQPVAQSHVLRVSELRGSDTLAVKIFGLLNSAVIAHDQGSTAAGRTSDYADGLAVGSDIAVDGRI